MDTGFDLQPIEKRLDRLSARGNRGIKAVAGAQGIQRLLLSGRDQLDHPVVPKRGSPCGVGIGPVGKQFSMCDRGAVDVDLPGRPEVAKGCLADLKCTGDR